MTVGSIVEEPLICMTLRWREVDSKLQFREGTGWISGERDFDAQPVKEADAGRAAAGNLAERAAMGAAPAHNPIIHFASMPLRSLWRVNSGTG